MLFACCTAFKHNDGLLTPLTVKEKSEWKKNSIHVPGMLYTYMYLVGGRPAGMGVFRTELTSMYR